MKNWFSRQPQKGILVFLLVLSLPGIIPAILTYEAGKRWWLRHCESICRMSMTCLEVIKRTWLYFPRHLKRPLNG